jgi:hypothetical protein
MSLYVAQHYATERNKGIDHASGRAGYATSCKNGQRHATRGAIPIAEGPKKVVPVTEHTEA